MENQEQQAQPQPELGIADLQNLRALVEVAIRRGTFGPRELSSVGAVYDRLAAFLDAVAPAPAPAQTEAAPEGENTQEQQPAQ